MSGRRHSNEVFRVGLGVCGSGGISVWGSDFGVGRDYLVTMGSMNHQTKEWNMTVNQAIAILAKIIEEEFDPDAERIGGYESASRKRLMLALRRVQKLSVGVQNR